MSSINFIGGEKGGVGKSVTARVLAQYFIDHSRPFVGFDTDRSHSSFTRFYEGFASSFISLRGPPAALATGNAVSCRPINHRRDGSRRWCALRSEIKEEPEGRGTFAEQSTPSA